MHVTEEKSLELATYGLKDIAYDWVTMCKGGRVEDALPMSW